MTTKDSLISSSNKNVLDEESSINAYFSAIDDLTYQNIIINSSETKNEVTKIDIISSKEDATYHQNLSIESCDLKNCKNDENKKYDHLKNATLISSYYKKKIQPNLSLTNFAEK